MKDDRFVRVVAVIVVPVDDGAGCSGREGEDVHGDHPHHVRLAGAGQQIVGHHAHQRTGHHPEKFFHRRPTLNRGSRQLVGRHPIVHHGAELGHLQERCRRNAPRRDVPFNARKLFFHLRVVVLQAVDTAEDLRQVQRFDGNAAVFQELLAEADGIERRGTRAQHPHSKVFEPLHYAAGGGECLQVGLESFGRGRHRMLSGQRKSDSVLPQVVADRNLSAEAVAPPAHQHFIRLVGIGVDQDRHVEVCHANAVGHAALVAEIRQAYHDAFNFVTMLSKQLAATKMQAVASGLGLPPGLI